MGKPAATDRPRLPSLSHSFTLGLVVTEAAPLVEYILSGRLQLTPEEEQTFHAFVGQELRRHGGALVITKDSGLFEAVRPV